MAIANPFFPPEEPIAPPIIIRPKKNAVPPLRPTQVPKKTVPVKKTTAPGKGASQQKAKFRIEAGKRICPKCSRIVAKNSIRCFYCNALREDEASNIAKSRKALAVMAICLFFIIITGIAEWPKERNWDPFGNRPNNYSWHQKIQEMEKTPSLSGGGNDFMSMMLNDLKVGSNIPTWRWQFSIYKFFTSSSGWFVTTANFIFLIFAGIACKKTLLPYAGWQRQDYKKNYKVSL